ncbi:MAG: SIR2 family protein [Rhodospirillaceae bacterium]|nr:SIR2 family protein [Rhodospirillaceae bacterium]
MISRQLIDLVNSGRAVSITGSGISADAGIPTWNRLLELVADTLEVQERCDTAAARALASSGRLPEAFQALADTTSRSNIHDRVTTIANTVQDPGRYHIQLADWPFCFYITTNYDHLLENASRGRLASVGNRGSELHKIGGGNAGFVWHLHGGCGLGNAASSLVVTRGDYEDYYPSSNVVDKLKASATSHQCVFIGFGFNSPR